MKDVDCFSSLYKKVGERCGFEALPFPYFVRSAHGETVRVRNPDGSWVAPLRFENDGSAALAA